MKNSITSVHIRVSKKGKNHTITFNRIHSTRVYDIETEKRADLIGKLPEALNMEYLSDAKNHHFSTIRLFRMVGYDTFTQNANSCEYPLYTHTYFDPTRERDPYSLPDCEVWYNDDPDLTDEFGESLECGYYWQSCFSGCLPDSDPMGPYDTTLEAINNARETLDDIDDCISIWFRTWQNGCFNLSEDMPCGILLQTIVTWCDVSESMIREYLEFNKPQSELVVAY